MNKVISTLFLLFLSISLFGEVRYFRYPLMNSNTYNIKTESHPIYIFNSKELVKKIDANQTNEVFIKKRYSDPYLLSSVEISDNNVQLTTIEKEIFNEYRNSGLERVKIDRYFMAVVVSILFVVLGGIKLFSTDTYYTYIMPFSTYSTTTESMVQMGLRNLFVPSVLFVFCFSSILFLNQNNWIDHALYNVLVILVVLFFKWIISRLISDLFDLGSFFKQHFMEFLKYGIVLSILFVFIQSALVFNGFDQGYIYKFSLLLYVFVWLVRLIIMFYRETNRNFIYFFSYLCATEGIPVLLLLVFWA